MAVVQTAAVGFEVRTGEIEPLALGSRGASAEELATLDERGFVVVPALVADTQVARLAEEFERLIAEDPQSSSHELGTRRSTADNDNEVFAVCWRHRVVLDAAAHVLGDRFQVGHVDLRDPDPGHGVQRYHPDHGETPVPGITATWFLDPFTAENGATRVLPGTHRPGSPPAGAGSLPPVPGEAVTVGPAGSVLLREARLYHAAGRNVTTRRRRGALVFYQHLIPESG